MALETSACLENKAKFTEAVSYLSAVVLPHTESCQRCTTLLRKQQRAISNHRNTPRTQPQKHATDTITAAKFTFGWMALYVLVQQKTLGYKARKDEILLPLLEEVCQYIYQ